MISAFAVEMASSAGVGTTRGFWVAAMLNFSDVDVGSGTGAGTGAEVRVRLDRSLGGVGGWGLWGA